MKRILPLILTVLLIFSIFSGCEKKNTDTSDKLCVLGTVFPPYDFAREIGGELIYTDMLMSPGTDSHSYSGDNPSDILKIAGCDLFIYVGGESESKWVERILSTIEKAYGKTPATLNLSEYCDLLEENSNGTVIKDGHSGLSFSLHDEHHEEHTHVECAFDEHIWTSLNNAEKMVDAITQKLGELDSDNKNTFEKNAKEYKEELQDLDKRFEALFANATGNAFIFADRFPFAYFSNSYGLECYAAFGGCATENEPSPTTLAALLKIMEEKNIKNIFYIETSKSNVPAALCKKSDTKSYLIHSCHTVTDKQLKEGVSYLSLMENNFENFRKALSND